MTTGTMWNRPPPSCVPSNWINFLDTADAYGIGDNEELVGKTIRGRRGESACEASLKRLGVEHRVDQQTPIEDTVRDGGPGEDRKVQYLGLSHASPAIIRRADKDPADCA